MTNTYLILVIDQFEELFTLCEREDERSAFIDLLLYEATQPDHRGVIILTMRADFYGRASQYPTLAQALTVHQLLVAPMTPRELREAILLPAEEVGLEMERELALALVQDTINEPGALPLLQHALLELFSRRSEDNVLTLATYQEIGGVRGALANRADDVLNHLTPEQQELARNIFLRLTTLGEGVSDTRRRVSRQELYPAGADPVTIDTVLHALSGQEARLVVVDEESVEVTHEALIQQWGQLRDWLEENRDSLRIHRRVTEAAKEWEANESDDSYLFRGARLAEAEAWVEANKNSLTKIEQAFLAASSAEAKRELEEARQTAANLRRRALIAGGVGVVAVIAAIVAVVFFFNARESEQEAQQNLELAQTREIDAQNAQATAEAERATAQAASTKAIEQEQLAVNSKETAEAEQVEAARQANIARSRLLAAQSDREFKKYNYDLALLLAVESGKAGKKGGIDAFETFAALRQTFVTPRYIQLDGWFDQPIWNRDGSLILTLSGNTVQVWDAQTGEERLRLPHDDDVFQAIWNGDESLILTRSGNTVRVWDAQTGDELFSLLPHDDDVFQAIWNADESLILTLSGNTVQVWDTQTGEERLRLPHEEPVNQASWNGDESLILTSSDDNTAQVWDAQTGDERLRLPHDDDVLQASWNGDESLILTRSGNTVRVWDAQTGEERLRLPNFGSVLQAIWNADESLILTRSNQLGAGPGPVRVWDAQTGDELFSLPPFDHFVWHVIWKRDESLILTSSWDGTARVWDVQTGEERLRLPHDDDVLQAIWNEDESLILTSSWDGTARVWDAQTGDELFSLPHDGSVEQAIWNADESLILTRSAGDTVRVWDVQTGVEGLRLPHDGAVDRAIWNGDESLILTSSGVTVQVWDAQTGDELFSLPHDGSVLQAIWNGDESLILTRSAAGTVRVWDAQTGDELFSLLPHDDDVLQAIWNGDKSLILTRSGDNTARVWDAQTGDERFAVTGSSATWNSDESILLAINDREVLYYHTQLEDLLPLACERAHRNLTRAEWRQFIGDAEPYRATCPDLPIESEE